MTTYIYIYMYILWIIIDKLYIFLIKDVYILLNMFRYIAEHFQR